MNRGYRFSANSLKHLNNGVDRTLVNVVQKALIIANTRKLFCPDFGISCGFRSRNTQAELYGHGRFGDTRAIVTNIDGIKHISKHNLGLAIDFYAYVGGKANYEAGNLALIATCFFEAASDEVIDIDWGGSFKSLSDGAHIEIKGSWK